MKYKFNLYFLIFISLTVVLTGCRYEIKTDPAGMAKIQEELDKKFPADSWYSEIAILHRSEGDMMRVKMTTDPNSLQGKSWVLQGDGWTPLENVVFQFNDNNPKQHLFQLNKDVRLATISDLIHQSQEELKEKNIDGAVVTYVAIQSAAIVQSPERRILYSISFKGKDNKNYSFVYDLNGKLVRFNS